MARNLDPAAAEAIGRGAYPVADALLFDIGGVLYGFWSGTGPLDIEGITYQGAGSLLEIEALNVGVDLSASPITIRLRAQPDTALNPDLLGTIDDYPYKNAPARLSLIYFETATGLVPIVMPWWRGYIDRIEHDETVGGEYALVAHLEPASLDHSRRGYRKNSDADQKLLDPTDRFFEHAATTPTEDLPYGRKSTGAAGKTAGKFG